MNFDCKKCLKLLRFLEDVDQLIQARTGTIWLTQRSYFIQAVGHVFYTQLTLVLLRNTADQLQQSYQHPPFSKETINALICFWTKEKKNKQTNKQKINLKKILTGTNNVS